MLPYGWDHEVVSATGVELGANLSILGIDRPADDLARAGDLTEHGALCGHEDVTRDVEALLLCLLCHSFEASAFAEDLVHRTILGIVGVGGEGRRDREESDLVLLYSRLCILCLHEDGERSLAETYDSADGHLIERIELQSRIGTELIEHVLGEGAILRTEAVGYRDEPAPTCGLWVDAVLPC